jgi:hypothetical protein
MHYEKAPPIPRVAAVTGAGSVPLRCTGIRSATAALRGVTVGCTQWEELQKDIGKSSGEWHFYLEGKDNR